MASFYFSSLICLFLISVKICKSILLVVSSRIIFVLKFTTACLLKLLKRQATFSEYIFSIIGALINFSLWRIDWSINLVSLSISLELLTLFFTKMQPSFHISSLKNQQQIQQSIAAVVLVVLQMKIVALAEEVLLLTIVVKIVAGKERT